MKTVRIGVIGVGHLGSIHTKLISKIPEATLIGVFDLQREKADLLAQELQTQSFTSFDSMLDSVDAVSIATSTTAHFEIASRTIEKGKHIFIEKPITETSAQAKILNESAAKRNIIIQVGHIERFNPAIIALEKYNLNPLFIESHRLAQFNPRGSDVAVVLDLMIHDIDLILSLVKSKVMRIDASGIGVISDTPDIANARLEFENGCIANVTASRISQKKMRKMRIFQHDAYFSIDFSEQQAEVFYVADPNDTSIHPTSMLGSIDKGKIKRTIAYDKPKIKDLNPLQHELTLFVESVRTGNPPAVSGEDGQRALEVAEEILKQIQYLT